jgi:hypothetical protein
VLAERVLAAVGGSLLVVWVLDGALRTFVLPRGATVLLTRLVFRSSRVAFDALARRARGWTGRDRVMAMYAPTTLVALPFAWVFLVFVGFGMLFWSVEHAGWNEAFVESGSSLLTLGFQRPSAGVATWIAFLEAVIGLGLIALLIAYLPTIYAAFSRREVLVSKLSVRAGTPPSAVELLLRAHRAGYLEGLDALWQEWETWFAEVAETHTSLGVLSFFRSPNRERSWATASGVVLDAAALRYAIVRVPWTPSAGLCIRSGYLALREIAAYYAIPFDAAPRPDDPISIAREEFDEVCDQLAAAGVPVRPDRDRAWRDFAGWRVNYDAVLLRLCGLVMAPYAPWSSDRSLNVRRRLGVRSVT